MRGYDVATARNRIAQMAIDRNTDYVLMVDNDVVLPKDALTCLLEDAKEVCLGYYAHRNADNRYGGKTCICKLKDGDGKLYYHYPLESEYSAKEMQDMKENGETKIPVRKSDRGLRMRSWNGWLALFFSD